jgi:6-phospho-3-hexuloisomerase
MNTDPSIDSILPILIREMESVLSQVKQQEVESLVGTIVQAERVFLFGAGRVGIATRALAMRLAQLGKTTHWIPDDTTPGIGKGDLLIANSGSGGSMSTYNLVSQARTSGATVATITANPKGKIADLADVVLTLPAQTFKTDRSTWTSVMPMGSQFELCLWILQDIIALTLMKELELDEADMSSRHRNLE